MAENKSADHLDDFEKIEIEASKLTGPGKKHLIDFLDAALILLIVFLVYFFGRNFFNLNFLANIFSQTHLLVLILFALYRLICFLFMGKTLTMLALGCYYVKPNGSPFTIADRILAACMIYRDGLALYNK